MTKIEWCDASWNPIVGCSRISEECRFCYAATAAASARLQRFSQYKTVTEWDGTVNFVESQLHKPLHWQKPKKIFVCSMSDIFHENVPDEWRDRIFAVAAIARQHTYQVLTKRAQRMVNYFEAGDVFERWANVIEKEFLNSPCLGHLLDELTDTELKAQRHLWLGVTAGCQSSVNERLPLLSKLTRADWTTFVSAEPLLEELNLGFDFPGYQVSQVITGAESGSGARPMSEDWVRSLRDQCRAAKIAFFYKQNFQKGRKISLPELDGRSWAEFPVIF